MKILFLSHYFYPNIGGIETVSDILIQAFHKAGHEVRLLTWTKEEGNRSFPFPVIRNPSLFCILKEHWWAELVFENNPAVRLGWPRLLFRRKAVIALHTWIERKQGTIDTVYFFKRKYLASANKVIACSEAMRDRCWKDAVVIENPYRDDLFLSLPGIRKTKDFIFLGRLVSDKGPELAVRALAQMIGNKEAVNNERATLTVTGEGNEEKKLRQLVSDLKLEERVHFTGALRGEALVECLNRHRFIVVPSVWEEPFGLVVLEGMACGCVPVASDSGGLPEAAGDAGITFAKGNADDMALCMETIAGDGEMEKRLRANAPAHLQKHTVSYASRRYLSEIENI